MKILIGIVIGVVVLSITRPYLERFFDAEHKRLSAGSGTASTSANADGYGLHFSPAEDLEAIDVKYLREAHETVDVAMGDFADETIANTLKQLAVGHVKIRIYRDPNHLRQEQTGAEQFHRFSTSTILRGSVNIQIRTPQQNGSQGMHLASWCVDHRLLRDGSAPWSAEGEKRQDNQLRVTTDPGEVAAFEKTFDAMWTRASNQIIQ
jgi:hypothetical protein